MDIILLSMIRTMLIMVEIIIISQALLLISSNAMICDEHLESFAGTE